MLPTGRGSKKTWSGYLAEYDERGALYICQDTSGQTLYVGQTVNYAGRRRSHFEREWWSSVALVLLIPAFDTESRKGAERALIQVLDPIANIMHRGLLHEAHITGSAARQYAAFLTGGHELYDQVRRREQERAAAEKAEAQERGRLNATAWSSGEHRPLEIGLDSFAYFASTVIHAGQAWPRSFAEGNALALADRAERKAAHKARVARARSAVPDA